MLTLGYKISAGVSDIEIEILTLHRFLRLYIHVNMFKYNIQLKTNNSRLYKLIGISVVYSRDATWKHRTTFFLI